MGANINIFKMLSVITSYGQYGKILERKIGTNVWVEQPNPSFDFSVYEYDEIDLSHEITCDFCGKADKQITQFRIEFGYGSMFDGDSRYLGICDDCYSKVIDRKEGVK